MNCMRKGMYGMAAAILASRERTNQDAITPSTTGTSSKTNESMNLLEPGESIHVYLKHQIWNSMRKGM